MSKFAKYRLGNQPEVYGLSEEYLGGKPLDFANWDAVIFDENMVNRRPCPFTFNLADASGKHTVCLVFHQLLTKDAFPMSFFGEARSGDWYRFAKVSLEEDPWELFIIPLH